MSRSLFDGSFWVHYAQFSLGSGTPGTEGDLYAAFRDQSNGLCGGAIAGFLQFITGLHTGQVGLRVELHETEPALDDGYEDAVEVDFVPSSDRVSLADWNGAEVRLALPWCPYRVRFCGAEMDAARLQDTSPDDDSVIDRYLLQFWPRTSPQPDRVLRIGSEAAAYSHRTLGGRAQRG